jgi:hypothetical protein
MRLLSNDVCDRDRSVRRRRTTDEHAPQALLEKARVDEVLQHRSTHLAVEACHLRGSSGGEFRVGVDEQTSDTRERFFDTSRLEWLLHGLGSSTVPSVHSRITTTRAGV